MKFETFIYFYNLSLEFDRMKSFVKAVDFSKYEDKYTEKSLTQMLKFIYSLAHGTIMENRKDQEVSRIDLSEMLEIPRRTIQNRELNMTKTTKYDKTLLDYVWFTNSLFDEVLTEKF